MNDLTITSVTDSMRNIKCGQIEAMLSIDDFKVVIYDGYICLKCEYDCPECNGFFESRVRLSALDDDLRKKFEELINTSSRVLRELIAEKIVINL